MNLYTYQEAINNFAGAWYKEGLLHLSGKFYMYKFVCVFNRGSVIT